MNIFIRIYENINNKPFLNAILINKYNIFSLSLIIKLSRLNELEDIIFILISISLKSRAKNSNIKSLIYSIFIILILSHIFIIKLINYNNYKKRKIKTTLRNKTI